MRRFGFVSLFFSYSFRARTDVLPLLSLSPPLSPTPPLASLSQAQDLTDPSSLLVSHNRSSPHPHASNPKMVKMRPDESVLSPDELESQQEEGRVAFEKLAMFGREGEEDVASEGEEEEEGMITAPEEEERGEGWVSKRLGRQVVAVSRREWDEVLGVADVRPLRCPLASPARSRSRLKLTSARFARADRIPPLPLHAPTDHRTLSHLLPPLAPLLFPPHQQHRVADQRPHQGRARTEGGSPFA